MFIDVSLVLDLELVDFIFESALDLSSTPFEGGSLSRAAGTALEGAEIGGTLTIIRLFLALQESIKLGILLIDLIFVGLLQASILSIVGRPPVVIAVMTTMTVSAGNMREVVGTTDGAATSISARIVGPVIATGRGRVVAAI